MMRFEKVLTFNKSKGKVDFNLKHFCQMRDVTTDDVSHLGKIVRYIVLYQNDYKSYRIHFTKWHILFKNDIMYFGKYKVDDFNMGFVVLTPFALFILLLLNSISIKLYIIIGVICLIYLKKN